MFNPMHLFRVDHNPIRALLDYANGNGYLHGFFAVAYGIITFVFGDELWRGPAYYTANLVYWAPQSWGLVAMILGVFILFSSYKGKERLLRWACFFMGMWCFVFGLLFIIDLLETRSAFGVPPIITYYHAGFLMINRSVLSKKMSGREGISD